MPHFGLMSTEDSFKTEAGALLRAKLHIRAGKRRLRQGKISAGIVTLYDSLLFALHRYTISPDLKKSLIINEGDDLKNERVVYAVLVRSGVLDGKFDYQAFDDLAEKAGEDEMTGFDYMNMLKGFESVMTQLGVMPFDESKLPPEDPSTF
ncbi:MAG: hypothetical protein AB1632_10360 [Nitrospirota bacterium]